jgi:long-chain acyl-CoA synthetase
VEEAIYLHPSVAECIVIGVADAKSGQAVKAFIKLKDGATLTAGELGEFLKDKLSPIERPRHVEFRTELPKTMIGKLSKKALQDEEAAKHTG